MSLMDVLMEHILHLLANLLWFRTSPSDLADLACGPEFVPDIADGACVWLLVDGGGGLVGLEEGEGLVDDQFAAVIDVCASEESSSHAQIHHDPGPLGLCEIGGGGSASSRWL